MIYFSIAMVAVAIILQWSPITIHYHKVIEVRNTHQSSNAPIDPDIEQQLNEDNKQVTFDDLLADVNSIMHDMAGDDID